MALFDVQDVQEGKEELLAKTLEEIERETAVKWGSRAVASYLLCEAEQDPGVALRRLYEGEGFRQEALEHAAASGDRGALVAQVQDEIDPVRRRAILAVAATATARA